MTGSLYYDRKGEPLDVHHWADLFGDDGYRTIAQHWARGWMISTIWLGLDHGFGHGHMPLIFETMIFPPGDAASKDGAWAEEYQERYSTEEAAHAGHDRAIAWLAERLGDDVAADLAGPLVPGSGDSDWDGSLPG
jgi:hypothetical protein